MLINKYTDEKNFLTTDIETLNERLVKNSQTVADVDGFILQQKFFSLSSIK